MSSFIITAAEAEQGSVTVNPDGTMTYTVPSRFSGSDTVTYTAQGRMIVKPADQAPVTASDDATVMAGDMVAIDVLANDVDPEGQALTVTGAVADQGSVTVNPDGTLSFAAPVEFSGTATITYTAADPAGTASEGTVTVTVTPYVDPNKPPVAAPDTATVVAGGTVEIDVLGNDADPEGEALTIAGATADRGSVTVGPYGVLSYTAPADSSGTATITYTVADAAGKSSQGTVAVEIVALSVSKGDVEGEFVVGSAPGEVTITILDPADYAGEYVVQTAALAAGPVSLVPPRIAGTAAGGATLTALPGLWAFEEADGPLTVTRQWVRGTAPIPGQTGATYVVDATADAERTLSVVETAGTTAGTGEAASAGIAVPAQPKADPWTPGMLPSLAVWLDPSDAETLTRSGGDITQLADKSGNGRHALQVKGHPAPILDATLNGKPVLRFPSKGILRTVGATLPGLPGMPGVTVIAVTQAHRTETFSECASIRNAASAGGEHVSLQTGFSIMWFGNGNRYWKLPATGPVVSVARYPENGTHGDAEWWRNGTKLAWTSTAKSGNSASLPADAFFKIGDDDGPSSEIAECLLVIGPLSDADRQKAEGYLAHKWGLAGQLPAAHPYKAGPPA